MTSHTHRRGHPATRVTQSARAITRRHHPLTPGLARHLAGPALAITLLLTSPTWGAWITTW